MVKKFVGLLFCTALVVGTSSESNAKVADCEYAVDQYNTVIDDLDTRIRRYSSCLSSSQGRDDCSSEFRRLRSAQSDFESAVYQVQSDCDL